MNAMGFDEYKNSLTGNEPPASLSPHLASLWHDAKGDWEKAHHIIQDINDRPASEIHAYLHRKEGDQWNADYWYRRAGTSKSNLSLENEWTALVIKILRNALR